MSQSRSSPQLGGLDQLPAAVGHHLTQAVLSLPFPGAASVKSMPGVESLQAWHGAQMASLSSALGAQLDRLRGGAAASTSGRESSSDDAQASYWYPPKMRLSRSNEKRAKNAKKPDKHGGGGADGPIVALEFTRGKRRVYRQQGTSDKVPHPHASPFSVADDHVTPRRHLRDAAASYLLPQGFPDSVAPQYATYMGWRGVQYFFGGAMSVFTTRSLLGAVGIANRHSGEAAAAINWVVKDGAGRMGRFLFARWGRELDCELKQFRLGGDILMETGAALELATALAPRLFLPLACTANLAKNLAAVAASSTRAPIYRTFARHNNLADVTAKGESVANLADVLGTICGIILARANLPVVPTFAALSVGYLVASRREVDSVELPYLNRARLSYAARAYLASGSVPLPPEANRNEPLLPWADPHAGRIVLGATVEEACASPAELKAALDGFNGRQYALTYRADTKKAYVLLRQGAGVEASLAGALHAHALIHLVTAADAGSKGGVGKKVAVDEQTIGRNGGALGRLRRQAAALRSGEARPVAPGAEAVEFLAAHGGELCGQFEAAASRGGWRLPMTMLNPSETRICPV